MAGRARGRGRGLRSGNIPLRQPEPETIARIVQESTEEAREGQFEDAVEPQQRQQPTSPPQQPTVQPGITQTPHWSSQGQEATQRSETRHKPDSDTVQEIKAALKQGAKVESPLTHDLVSSPNKLNPTALPFTPSPSSSSESLRLNPNSAEFSPTGRTNGNLSTPLLSKLQPQAATALFLNPNSQEFIPQGLSGSPENTRGSLNVTAPEFVPKIGLPTSMQNGDLGLPEQSDDTGFGLQPSEEEMPTLTPVDIVKGFERVSTSSEDDDNGSIVLKTCAETLIKATMYPGSFDRLRLKLQNTIKAWPPSEATLDNMAEMLVHWGIAEPGLRYTSSRVCQALCEMKIPAGEFNKRLMARLHHWFLRQKGSGDKSPEGKEQLINFSLFFAELFSRIRVGDAPVKILGIALFELLAILLNLKDDRTVIGACNVLKLTGALLESCDGSPGKMEGVMKTLKELAVDDKASLSSRSTDLMLRVVELHAKKWGKAVSPATTPTQIETPLHQFMFPSKPSGSAMAYEPAQIQAPVTNPEEWNEFLDDNNQVIEDTDSPEFLLPDDDEGLDPEIQQEFEAFIEEIEEHLMMQDDFDPEEQQETDNQ